MSEHTLARPDEVCTDTWATLGSLGWAGVWESQAAVGQGLEG